MDATGRERIVRAAFRAQSDACRSLGSPFTARICDLLAERLTPATAAGARVLGWAGDPTSSGDSVPLRTCGALNYLVVSGADGELAAVYPPMAEAAPDAELWAQIERVLAEHGDCIDRFLDSAPQTNEVRRSAVLLAGWCWLAKQFELPLVVSEVGASAGLNLFADRYWLKTEGFSRGSVGSPVRLEPRWSGDLPADSSPVLLQRRGCDLSPLDPLAAEDHLRLLAYTWPDQRDRVDRMAAAASIFSDAAQGTIVDRLDAADWLETRLAAPLDGAVHVVQHTIAWQYFPEQVKERGHRLLAEAGARATQTRPLARLSLEADGESPGAGISLAIWPGGETHSLGRADFHGRWVDWRNPRR